MDGTIAENRGDPFQPSAKRFGMVLSCQRTAYPFRRVHRIVVTGQLKGRTSAEHWMAFMRTPEKAKDLGIEARTFDYSKTDRLSGVPEGVDRLILIPGSEAGQRTMQHKNIIVAAVKAGVKRMVGIPGILLHQTTFPGLVIKEIRCKAWSEPLKRH